MHDIFPIQLGPNIAEGNITKSGQDDLSERAISDWIASNREKNLVWWEVDRLWRARSNHKGTRGGSAKPFQILWMLSFAWASVNGRKLLRLTSMIPGIRPTRVM